jgi:MFS transporter, putative metabolite:H+ symporter
MMIGNEARIKPHTITAGEIGARLDRLGSSKTIWLLVVLISCASFFEGYTIFMAAYIAPGIVKAGILTPSTRSFFGTTGYASFIAATFAGFLVGTSCISFIADRFGRRSIFTWALLWFSLSSAVMAFQTTASGLNFWRFMSGIGVGVEMVTIDAYLSELMPKASRGKAFALGSIISFIASPICAALALWLVDSARFDIEGWRWVVLIGSLGAIVVWPLRLAIPESPRWLVARGHFEAADRIVFALERRVERETGRPLAPLGHIESVSFDSVERGRVSEIFSRDYLSRTIMLCIFNIFQSVGLYGFGNWVPTFLVHQGINVTTSLGYSLGMALAAPVAPAIALFFADRFERKWQIVVTSLVMAGAGLVFSQVRDPALLVASGAIVTMCGPILNYCFHAYQAELYPTRIRAWAVGFVYSWSRLSGFFSSFFIAAALGSYGVTGALGLISGSMLVVAVSIGLMGPKTTRRSLETLAH